MKFFLYILLLSFSFNLSSQGLDEEIGFLYTKAKYLLSTDRTEDAIKVLNKIVAQNANYEDALLLRAESKYALGAYAGVRKDLNAYMSKNGITPRVARLYGLADFQGGKEKAALNSVNLALSSIKDDKLLYETRASLMEKDGKLIQACKDYKAAAKLGSAKAKRNAKKLCGDYEEEEVQKTEAKKKKKKTTRKKTQNTETPPIVKKEDAPDVIKHSDKNNTAGTQREEEKEIEEDTEVIEEVEETQKEEEKEVIEEVEEEDITINEIKIDDDVTILISGEGLGSREVMNQPNILIISDQSGEVVIDICVSRGGRVTSATFDNINSSIKKQSLVSLAVRKAKEFWFDAGIGNDKCGKIVFKITSG